LHDPAAGRAEQSVIGRWNRCQVIGCLRVYVSNFRGWGLLVSGMAGQVLAEDSQPLPETRAKEAIVAHLDQALGQDVL
jgi:hypothetical protein